MNDGVRIVSGDNLPFLESTDSSSINLIYIDPPFNTGKTQKRETIGTVRCDHGDRVGFQGATYKTTKMGATSYEDSFDDYLSFIKPRLLEAYRVLSANGSFFFHIDYRESHYCKILLDEIFGRESFMNEIIWAYDYGGRSKTRWSCKHDTIFWYAKNPKDYTFNFDEMDRIPYMAPGLVGAEKAARGKTPTDVWWHTIVPTNSKERTGYATQKPVGLLNRIVKIHSSPGDKLLDFFAGSGSFGQAATDNNRDVVLVDNNPEAIEIMNKRFGSQNNLSLPTPAGSK